MPAGAANIRMHSPCTTLMPFSAQYSIAAGDSAPCCIQMSRTPAPTASRTTLSVSSGGTTSTNPPTSSGSADTEGYAPHPVDLGGLRVHHRDPVAPLRQLAQHRVAEFLAASRDTDQARGCAAPGTAPPRIGSSLLPPLEKVSGPFARGVAPSGLPTHARRGSQVGVGYQLVQHEVRDFRPGNAHGPQEAPERDHDASGRACRRG